jgi:hypothetical protein
MKKILVRSGLLVAVAFAPVLCCGQNSAAPSQDTKEVSALDIERIRKAAEKGDAHEQCVLGEAYYLGRGVPQDYIEAVKWLRKSAEQGFAESQYNLGKAYRDGHGVPQNDAEAVKFYRKAAEQGHAKAQGNLSVACRNGQDVPQDIVEAYKWATLSAAKLGEKNIIKYRDDLMRDMTSEQIAEGQKRAAVFVAKTAAQPAAKEVGSRGAGDLGAGEQIVNMIGNIFPRTVNFATSFEGLCIILLIVYAINRNKALRKMNFRPPVSTIKFACPKCQQPLDAPADMAGEKIDCPACSNPIAIPPPPSPH